MAWLSRYLWSQYQIGLEEQLLDQARDDDESNFDSTDEVPDHELDVVLRLDSGNRKPRLKLGISDRNYLGDNTFYLLNFVTLCEPSPEFVDYTNSVLEREIGDMNIYDPTGGSLFLSAATFNGDELVMNIDYHRKGFLNESEEFQGDPLTNEFSAHKLLWTNRFHAIASRTYPHGTKFGIYWSVQGEMYVCIYEGCIRW